MRKNYQSLHNIEGDIRRHMSALENAKDEVSAAKAFQALQFAIEAYLNKAKDINSERWKLREIALKQAQQVSQFELSDITAGGEKATEQHFHINQPDVINVQNSPDFFFIRLSYGLLNIRHIIELDVKDRKLYKTTGKRKLIDEDIKLLIAQLRLFPAPLITKRNQPQIKWNAMVSAVAIAIPFNSAVTNK